MKQTLKLTFVLGLLAVLGVLGMVSSAQDTIDLPAAADVPSVSALNSAQNNGYILTLNYMNPSPADPTINFYTEMPLEAMTKIRYKFVDLETGEHIVIKGNPWATSCYNSGANRFCGYDVTPEQFAKFTDDHMYTTQVVVYEQYDTDSSGKPLYYVYKSNKLDAEISLIEPAESLNVVSTDQGLMFSWTDDSSTTKYIVKVINTRNGNLVYRASVNADSPDHCSNGLFYTCEIPVPALKDGITYKWFVISKNALGRVRSEKHTFIYSN